MLELRTTEVRVAKQLERNHAFIHSHFERDSDLFMRDLKIENRKAFLVAISGIMDKNMIGQAILAPLHNYSGSVTEENIIYAISVPHLETTSQMTEVIGQLLGGQIALFVDGIAKAFLMDVSEQAMRNVEEPASEVVVRGPHVGFIENIVINVAMIRRYMRNPLLRVEDFRLGKENQTNCALVYLDGTTHPGILALLKQRLAQIDVDAILGCGYTEQLIEDAPHSIFPTVKHSERPDTVVASLLEGRVAIFTDGCPTALIVPHLFIDNFQNPEDYHSRPYYSSVMRILRFISFFLSTQLPSLYVTVENFHKELVPSTLLVSVAGSREGVPFPLALEVLLMLFAFELIKEAGLRMPRAIGSSISIVGGLILGQAAVDSGFVGIPTVIIVAVAGMSSFLTSELSQPIALLRFASLIPSAFIGLYGLILFDLLVVLHLAALRSFGISFLVPMVPTYLPDWKDTLIRVGIRKLNTTDKKLRHNVGRYFEH